MDYGGRGGYRAVAPSVTDAFGKYSAFSGKSSSLKGGTVLIDAVIRRRVVRLEAPTSGRVQDSHLSLPADNTRSTVSSVQLPGRFLYVELQALPNENEHAARRQPFLPLAFTVDITTKTGYLYRLAFSTENSDVDVHLGKVARLPLPQISDRWTVLAIDLHAMLSLITEGHEHGAHYGYVCGFVFHANMLLRGAYLSDFILTGDALPDIMALPLPVNTRFARTYGWLWLPEPPEIIDPRSDLSKPVIDSRPWRSPPRQAAPAGGDSSRASVAVAPRQTTAGGSSSSSTAVSVAGAAGDVADEAAVRNAASASALQALSISRPPGLAGTYARLPMPPPPAPPSRASSALPQAARAAAAKPLLSTSDNAPAAASAAAPRGRAVADPGVAHGPALKAGSNSSRPAVETGAAALLRRGPLPGGGAVPAAETPATSVFHAPPPHVAALPLGSPTSAVASSAGSASAAAPAPMSARSLQRRDSRLSTGGASVGSLDSARGGAGRTRSPTAQGHQVDRQFDNPSIEPYRHHVAELANSALHDTKVGLVGPHCRSSCHFAPP
jgi:hypothetical protein